ncbi:hypothetical protein PM082_019167 [Marasmius tenuissimus]|nr:hypothetical protein PM082_019167 [Marasmius tenuissimus]
MSLQNIAKKLTPTLRSHCTNLWTTSSIWNGKNIGTGDAKKNYRSEVEAYRRLSDFQGSTIPNFLGHGKLNLPDRAISPPFILLEYIPDAVTLENIDPNVVPLVPRHLCEAFEIAVRQITQKGGIVHDQMYEIKILLSPSNTPTRITLIDFGAAYWEVPPEHRDWEETAFFTTILGF